MPTIPATPSDISQLIPWIPDESACLMWAGPLVSFPLAPAKLLKEIDYAPDNSFCFTQNGSMKGFGQLLSKEKNRLHMARIIVDPDSRGTGYGHKLCSDLIQIGRERNVTALSLNVYRDNVVGSHLYMGLGFKDIQEKSTPEYFHMVKILI